MRLHGIFCIFAIKQLLFRIMKKQNILFVLLTIVAMALPLSCFADAPRQTAKHVVLIGLDGWGGYSMPKADMPNVKELIRKGSHTFHKRSVLPSSSAPNWAAMFMGAPTEVHGYTTWGSKTPEIPSPMVNSRGMFPTIFSIVRDARPEAEIGVIYEWDGIKHLVDTLALSYYAQGINTPGTPDNLCALAEDYIASKRPALLAVCFDEPDHTGHNAGHDTPEYYEILKHLDIFVGRIVKAIEKAGIIDETAIIVTGDHGGINLGHGGITLQEMETPFVICGKGIREGYEFQGVMLQQDVAATIAAILGVEQPQAWNGKAITDIFTSK